MKRIYINFFTLCLLLALSASAQTVSQGNSLTVKIISKEEQSPIANAKISVRGTDVTALTDAEGTAILAGLPDGVQALEIFADGYEIRELQITFPRADPNPIVVAVTKNEVGEVIISTTRTGREIDDTATRVEAIDEEEVAEKTSMRAANVSMILSESTGIKVQQTSAVSNSQSVRIQGLDGRYTQLLKDGFPTYGGFAASLSVLDIPPLDLQQVEIVKGSSSTLYGGGAIAGVVNFVSRVPGEHPSTSLIFNQTSALGSDFSVFRTDRKGKFGYTFLGSASLQKQYDADGDSFSDLPRTQSFSVAPRAFFYLSDDSTLIVGNSTAYQKRQGGDMLVIGGRPDQHHVYFEKSDSVRNITNLQFDRNFANGSRLEVKQSVAFFTRSIETPNYEFRGRQFSSYTDLSYLRPVGAHVLVFGTGALYDRFQERPRIRVNFPPRDETRTTVGAYAQDSFPLTRKLSLEAGLRVDAAAHYGVFVLPRASALIRFNEHWSSRIGFGFGYKTPSIFTEEAETRLFRGVLPIGNRLEAERSQGVTADLNYRRTFGATSIAVNQLFFFTSIDRPLVLLDGPNGTSAFVNASHRVNTRGAETNVRLAHGLIKLFTGYTFIDAIAGYLVGDRTLSLTPRHRINSSLVLEKEHDFRIGFEAYFTGRQVLSDRTRARSFWIAGISGEKTLGKFSLFINAENITDTRQSRFGPVVLPPLQNPTFAELYAPTEGRLFNGGIKIRF